MARRILFTRTVPPAEPSQEASVLQKGIALNRASGKMYGYHGDPGQKVVSVARHDPAVHGSDTAVRVQSPGWGARLRAALSFRQRSDQMAPLARTFAQHGLRSSSSAAPTAGGGQIFRHSLVSPHMTADVAAGRLRGALGRSYDVGKVQGQNGQFGFTAKHRRTGAVHSFHFQENPDVAAVHGAMRSLGHVSGTTQVRSDKEGAYYQHTVKTPHPIERVDQHLRATLGVGRDVRHRVLGNGDHSFTVRDHTSGVRTKITVKGNGAGAAQQRADLGSGAQATPAPRPQAAPPIPMPKPAPTAKPAAPRKPKPKAETPAPVRAPEAYWEPMVSPAKPSPPPYRPAPSPDTAPSPKPVAPVEPQGKVLTPSEKLMQQNPRAFQVVQKGDHFLAQGVKGEVRGTHTDRAAAEAHVASTRAMYDRVQRELHGA